HLPGACIAVWCAPACLPGDAYISFKQRPPQPRSSDPGQALLLVFTVTLDNQKNQLLKKPLTRGTECYVCEPMVSHRGHCHP
ncbi:mCG145944, partial [Mus musculus]